MTRLAAKCLGPTRCCILRCGSRPGTSRRFARRRLRPNRPRRTDTEPVGIVARNPNRRFTRGEELNDDSGPLVECGESEGPMTTTALEMKVHDFLAQKRIAVAGV